MASEVATLVDTNVLLDVFSDDPEWAEWSSSALADAGDAGPLVINPIIYAELSVRFDAVEALDAALSALDVQRDELPYEAAFVAAGAFLEYRRRRGSRTSPLPDFYIGAHALQRGYRLLTRDAARYHTYFPELDVIAPGRPHHR
ncbi:type II toxin-antitoxin system VapC family toxin [Microbacterium foliorum]|uniref:type II toxin-antitoxin system VapC family toxin n=1 Tax=Microbacterium foliorum TaxID=104336 RepID=UPI0028D018BF|nr:type II toxin-antitoxin system VapC family toxin [Microbacterium foliorum]